MELFPILKEEEKQQLNEIEDVDISLCKIILEIIINSKSEGILRSKLMVNFC
jgi:hypothetical protein